MIISVFAKKLPDQGKESRAPKGPTNRNRLA